MRSFKKKSLKSSLNVAIENGQIPIQKIIDLKDLGEGESNYNFLAIFNDEEKVVIRIPILYDYKSLAFEYAFLENISGDIAPKPIFLDISKKIINHPFMIQEFVEGHTLNKWTDDLLAEFGSTLAKVHKQKRNSKNKLSIREYFHSTQSHFFNEMPTIYKVEKISEVLSKMDDFIKKNSFLFEKVDFNSVIHGDLNSENILFDNGRFRIIDWELAKHNDNARDFATFFYSDMSYFNWRVHLNESSQKVLFDSYLEEYGEDENLIERVKFWEVIDKVSSAIFCTWKYEKTSDDKFLTMSDRLLSSVLI